MAEHGARPRLRNDVGWVGIDDEIVLLDPRRHYVHVLSTSAGLLLHLLDGEGTVRELAEDIADVFQISTHDALRDVASFVEALGSSDLLEPGSPTSDEASETDDTRASDAATPPRYLPEPPVP